MSGVDNSIHNPAAGSGANANANQTSNSISKEDVALLREQIAYLHEQLNQRSSPAAVRPPKPDTFGGRREENVETWLFQVKQYLDLCKIEDEKTQVQMAAAFLKDTAAVWWRNRLTSSLADLGGLNTWSVFQTTLAGQFKPVNASKQARDRMARLRQTHSVQAYIHAFRSIALEIPSMTEEEKLDKFLRGLRDEIRVPVELRGPTSMEEAATFAERVDAIIHKNTTYRPRYSPADNSGPIPMEIDAIKRSKITDQERDQLRRTGGCFFCREIGHMARDCPRKRKSVKVNAIESETEDKESGKDSAQ